MAERGVIQVRCRPGCGGRPLPARPMRCCPRRRWRQAGTAHPALPVVVPAPVVTAAGPGADQCGRGVRQGERLALQVVRQVQGLGPLAGVGGEPRAEVGQGFPGAERGDGRDPAVRRGQGVIPPGRDHDPAVVSRRATGHPGRPDRPGHRGPPATAARCWTARPGTAALRSASHHPHRLRPVPRGLARSRPGRRSCCWPSPRPASPPRGYPRAGAPAPRPAASCPYRRRRRGKQASPEEGAIPEGAVSGPGTRIKVSPGSSLPIRPSPVSGRGLWQSARGGTGPQRSGHSTRRAGAMAIWAPATSLPLCACSPSAPTHIRTSRAIRCS